MYHRLIGRPPNGKPKFAVFKFMSYMKLTYGPAYYGVGLAHIPLIIGNVLITCLVSGHLMSFPIHIFSCNAGSDSACVYTVLDLIMD